MEVKCPNCLSRFNLPDQMAKAGRKLRCSVCKNVFTLDLSDDLSNDTALKKLELPKNTLLQKNKKKIAVLLSVVLFLVCVAGALIWEFVLKDPQPPALTDAQLTDRIKLLTMRNVRQYIVENEKVGKVFVIEGRVVNEFEEAKDFIEVEAAIYGRDKRVIATKKQRCGTQLSLFQLQVLSESEMEAALNDKVEILTNNVNIKHGGEVPFMVLFYEPPDDISEFGVRIINVRDAPFHG